MALAMPKETLKELDGLIRRLQSTDPEARSAAMSRLIEHESAGTIPLELLMEMADDPNPTHSMYAILALGRSKKSEAAGKLIELASKHGEGNPLFLETIVDALGESGDAAAAPVLLHMIGIDSGWKNKLLGRLGRKSKDEPDPEELQRREYFTLPVIRALEKIGEPKSTDSIAGYLDHDDPLVRCHAIRAFVNAKAVQHMARLKEIAEKDGSELVRVAAQIAVERLSPPPGNLSN